MYGSKKCRGYVSQAASDASVMCDAPAYGISFYTLGPVPDWDRTIRSGGIIKSFPDMTVPPGDLLLQYDESKTGRAHYLVLAKKTAP
ncbi:hypothetical protein [Paraburkholderia kirstenboschensis]|uniref:hypothetical protein n=1 Tax=Paraburkholderia kirstenboschensis TaxID=1245436 RepID=UPI001917DA18|nr:hypothetical protein [Paraburkholderia kirstenboschensis]